MSTNILAAAIHKLQVILKKNKINLVLIGGLAASIFAKPRATFDIDGLIQVTEKGIKKLLKDLKKNGVKFNQKQPLKQIAGLPFLTLYFSSLKIYADLFIVSNEFQKEIDRRARKIKFNKTKIKIASPEDLILLKLQSGRQKDLEDVREILSENKNKLNFKYLKKWAKKLNVAIFLEDELKSLEI